MRALISASVRRPVAVTALAVLAATLAAVAVARLPVALLPDLQYPGLAVWTEVTGGSAPYVEEAVTGAIEQAVAGASGLVSLDARSSPTASLVRMEFEWGTDLDLAQLTVREALDRAAAGLPDGVGRPVVLPLDPSQRPILIATATTDAGAGRQTDIGDLVRRRIEQVPGVARARALGAGRPVVEVRVDPAALASYGLGVEDVARALREANVALPSGTVQQGGLQYAVEVSGEFEGVADVARALVRASPSPVRLADVAAVAEGEAPAQGAVLSGGRRAVAFAVEKRPGDNTVETAGAVRGVLAELAAELPGVAFEVVSDESVFIASAIGGVVWNVVGGAVLAALVLILFLRHARTILAVAVAIPLSIGAALALMDLAGISVNLISLSGLALGVGMLVDNAVVVTENVARHRAAGQPWAAAAVDGAAEVAGPITASTLTTLAVFLPITFVEGLGGRLFRDQSLAVTFSLAASLLVALTVVPAILARSGGAAAGPPAGAAALSRMLDGAARRRGAVLAGVAGLAVAMGAVGAGLPREIVPRSEGGPIAVDLTFPRNAVAGRVEADARRALAPALALADRSVTYVGRPTGAEETASVFETYRASALLAPLEGATPEAVRAALVAPEDVAVEVRRVPSQLEALVSTGARDLTVDVRGTARLGAAEGAAIGRALAREPALVGVADVAGEPVPAYAVSLDPEALARHGVGVGAVVAALEAGTQGLTPTALRSVGDEVPITVRIGAEAPSLEALLAQRVPTPGGERPLATFVEVAPTRVASALVRVDQAPVLRFEADVAPGADLRSAAAAAERAAGPLLPPGATLSVGGGTDAFRAALRSVATSLLVSVLLVYLILAAQFESFALPLGALAVVPAALLGVGTTLAATGQSANLMSLTGAVVLVGIVVNGAIILVDVYARRVRAGVPPAEAAREAALVRARPIVMTTVTTVLGLLPLMVPVGEGAEIRVPLATAIVGGLVVGTAFTLVVLPLVLPALARPQS